MRPVWLVGSAGMLGRQVALELERNRIPFRASDREVDVADSDRLRTFEEGEKFGWIVNCSAYTAVDRAETERGEAFRVNALGAENLAAVSRRIGATLVHFSTDYVFDGTQRRPYREDDPPRPLNVYGQSKLDGERRVAAVGGRYFIFRLSGLYGVFGHNFVATMLSRFAGNGEPRVVDDQVGSPTYAGLLAKNLVSLIRGGGEEYGTYHCSDEGQVSWFDFAVGIGEAALGAGLIRSRARVRPVGTREYAAAAPRPAYSVLDKEKVKQTLRFEIRDWKANLENFFGEYRNSGRQKEGS